MIIKFLLIVWVGVGSNQVFAIDHFDTLAECEAARATVLEVTQSYEEYHICKPYTWSPSND